MVVHLHRVLPAARGDETLAEKVPRPRARPARGRWRPTLAVIPRGNWIRSTWYDFPRTVSGGRVRCRRSSLRGRTVSAWAAGRPADPDRAFGRGDAGARPSWFTGAAFRQPDELHLYDGLYGRDPALGDPFADLTTIDRWLGKRASSPNPSGPGALRVVYTQQHTPSRCRRWFGDLIGGHLATADPALAALVSRRYRVERSLVPHGVCCLAQRGMRFPGGGLRAPTSIGESRSAAVGSVGRARRHRGLDFGRYIARHQSCAAHARHDLGTEVISHPSVRGGGEDHRHRPGRRRARRRRCDVPGDEPQQAQGRPLDPRQGRGSSRSKWRAWIIVIANLPPAVLRSLALDLDSLRAVKPDIV